jgi:hypothetical protein
MLGDSEPSPSKGRRQATDRFSQTRVIQLTADTNSPSAQVLSGILVLVPGGIGIRGSAALLEHDLLSGLGFTIDMLVVSLSITLGLLIAKIVLPTSFFGSSRHHTEDQRSLAAVMADDRDDMSEEEEEDMAI